MTRLVKLMQPDNKKQKYAWTSLYMDAVISKSVFRYRKVPFYPINIDNVSSYGKFIDIDIDAQY